MIQVLFITMLILFLCSVPIAISLGFSSVIALKINDFSLSVLAQNIFESLDSFTLMAIPFFILAGNLMQTGGIAKRLIALANALVGWFRGGLGSVAVLTSMFFATLSGSSSATTAAIGTTLIPEMAKKKYPKPFATSLAAASGELGAIIPPSVPMIVYGLVANVSVGSLFIAGILPGIFIGLSLMVSVIIIAKVKGYDEVEVISVGEWAKNLWVAFRQSLFAMLMPVIILGGIYSGLFTPTEAAVVAVFYSLIIGLFIYKELKWSDLKSILIKSAISTSIILIIVAFASVFSYILTIEQVPHKLSDLVVSLSDSALVFLLLTNIFLLITGMFVETLAAIIVLAPILAPVAVIYGIDPIHFGLIMIVNLAIGMVTPPLGVNLFVACEIANLRIDQLIRPLLIFLAVLIVDLLIISYFAPLSTWLPSIIG
ncbi:TRAP transporter large permease [Psychrobacillus sp. OK032]|uniref:TRAP transporter large permease n=1 Tax=Psychrobacillus sp. OK032 TaxID=1884358 RepID=UPI0008D6B06B|nr:TRAP transporter large permease [Psychrobacillus sp. OK032]SES19150.1 C4-dicarboxylate transporter, DctM subunit [Psychrobacillus sp. OK032]